MRANVRQVWFGLVSLFSAISAFMGYLMPKSSLQKNSCGFSSPIAVDNKEIHNFSKGICLKVNVIAWLGFELAYYGIAIHHFTLNSTGSFVAERERERERERRSYCNGYHYKKWTLLSEFKFRMRLFVFHIALDIYRCLLPVRIWYKVNFIVGI